MSSTNPSTNWTPESWKSRPVQQLPDYDDNQEIQRVYSELKSYPPLITSWEVQSLRENLRKASEGKAFIMQGGDCAETFSNCSAPQIVNQLKVLLQMSFILIHELNVPVIRVGRFAGQYAKPRSSSTERVGDLELPTYRGDLINGFQKSEEVRKPDPTRLLEGYQKSAMTLNFVRALTEGGGFADLHHPEFWELDFMRNNRYYEEYATMVNSIRHALKFVDSISDGSLSTLKQVYIYTSHEALNLHYDSAQTRKVPHKSGWYNLSTHLPWLGNRTRNIDGAHVEYFRGIENPVGVKVGPPFDSDEIVELVKALNPSNEAGKVMLITRMGRKHIDERLPELVEVVKSAGLNVVWSCDPMHGNTFATEDGIKTRNFDDILEELKQTFQIHSRMGTYLGGAHLELTGDNVTECIGGARGLNADKLKENYQTYCDPRLNYQQSLEMAFLIARQWKEHFSRQHTYDAQPAI